MMKLGETRGAGMFRRAGFAVAFVLMVQLGAARAAPKTAFELDVAQAAADGLGHLVVSGALDADAVAAREARALSLLALLTSASGYAALDPIEQGAARGAVQRLADDDLCGAGRQFRAYCHGTALMALSLYARTGGPDALDGGGSSLRGTIDGLVDSTVSQQSTAGPTSGFWGYTGPGVDASATHFVAAGLAAARGYYIWADDAEGRPRLGALDEALARTAEGYARTRNVDGGTGYRVGEDEPSSAQQTAGALWSQLVGGASGDAPGPTASLGWLAPRYDYETFASGRDEWRRSYYGYLWTSAMAFRRLGFEDSGGRAHREPLLDARPAVRGFGGVGFYADTARGWAYDYGYTLMRQQRADGRFVPTSAGIEHGCWNDMRARPTRCSC